MRDVFVVKGSLLPFNFIGEKRNLYPLDNPTDIPLIASMSSL